MPDLTHCLHAVRFPAALTLAALASTAVAASEERDLRNYDEVVFTTSGELHLEQGKEYVRIEADEKVLPEIITEVRDGRLVIRRKEPRWSFRDDERITAYVGVDDLKGVTITGSGDGFAGKLETGRLDLKVSGSGELEIDALHADDLDIKVTGSGSVRIGTAHIADLDTTITGSGTVALAGEAADQDVRISGSGDYRAIDLVSPNAAVVVSGSGDVDVHATEELDIAISGSGSVRYAGRPSVSQVVSGSGSVKPMR